jgi:sugar-specific transcriptional regulator TrmB
LLFQDKAVDTLSGLGLTVLQAKVYLTLANGEKVTVKEIAKKSTVARQDLYRITSQLLNLGLIEKYIDIPVKFGAIPAKEAISILIERKKKQTIQLEQESKQFLSHFKADEGADLKDEEPYFLIINDLQACMNKVKKQIGNAKKSISIVTKWVFFLNYMPDAIEEYTEALNRGVHVNVITQVPKDTEVFPKNLQKLISHPNFKVRYISSLPSCLVAIFDKEVDIFLASYKTPHETGMLNSDNINLIELSHNYFEIMWSNATISCFINLLENKTLAAMKDAQNSTRQNDCLENS